MNQSAIRVLSLMMNPPFAAPFGLRCAELGFKSVKRHAEKKLCNARTENL